MDELAARTYFYDRQGQPVSLMTWAHATEHDDRTVTKTTVGDAEISTVFVGLDMGLGLGGPPLIFETMIFGGEHDSYQRRYSTEADALEGHQTILTALKAGQAPQ